MNVATAVSEMSGNRRLEPPSVCSWDITSPEKKQRRLLRKTSAVAAVAVAATAAVREMGATIRHIALLQVTKIKRQ